jgi:CheY-like chemotaxis protein
VRVGFTIVPRAIALAPAFGRGVTADARRDYFRSDKKVPRTGNQSPVAALFRLRTGQGVRADPWAAIDTAERIAEFRRPSFATCEGLEGAASMGSSMTFEGKSAGNKRVLVVEDELMIRMLLQDMLTDLGHAIAAETGRIDEAVALARKGEFDVAILDVNLNGQPVTPVVEVLVERGVPFVFATGYGQRGVPEPYRQTPTLQKPFQADALADAIKTVMAGGKA